MRKRYVVQVRFCDEWEPLAQTYRTLWFARQKASQMSYLSGLPVRLFDAKTGEIV